MDPRFNEFSNSINGFNFEDEAFLPSFDQSETLANTFRFKDDPGDLSFMEFPFLPPDQNPGFVPSMSSGSSEVDSPEDSDYSDNVLKFINTILLEENMEQKPSMFHDPLALRATEKSLYEVIGERYPASPNQPPLYFNQNTKSPDELFSSSTSEQSSNSHTSGGNSVDSPWIVDPGDYKASVQSPPFGYPLETTLQTTSLWSFGSTEGFSDDVNGTMRSSHPVPNTLGDSQSILMFKKGAEEASKFLDLEGYTLPPGLKEGTPEVVVKVEEGDRETSPDGSRGRKNHHREDSNLDEERSSKVSAVHVEEAELSEMFDKVLLYNVKAEPEGCYDEDEEVPSKATKTTQQNGQPHGSKGGKPRTKKQGSKNEVVDLRMLLINCAQSVAVDDRRTASEQLKQIRQHSSPTGDGSQRLANVFANGLEARLAGTGSQIYASLACKRISAAEKLKAYQLMLSACPYKKMSILFANKMIYDLATNSSKKKLHIVDFGILYGFQWPMVIQHLSYLPGGPPELRITGIELPQPGFRPAEFVDETGRRLAKYCERFNVQFQYHAIAQKWESIKIEDLNIYDDEVLAVNSMFRLDNLLDDTVMDDSPRDAVLKLIRKMNPDLFVHSFVNGSYNSPFFLTRFREALFHYSSLFDMMDTTIPREDKERMHFELEFCGREVTSVVACEGLERVERPETHKQWQVRTMRAGFRILPLNQELVKKFREKVKAGYHKDFMFDVDGQWMLQGWKGRNFCASACWVPA